VFHSVFVKTGGGNKQERASSVVEMMELHAEEDVTGSTSKVLLLDKQLVCF
jgi:hypothetical protein